MSERMTNVEIEDILSSIRRLVSEEARPPLVRQPPRLVLTEAERVDRAPAAPSAEEVLEARLSELEAMLAVPPAAAFELEEGDPFPSDPAPTAPRPAPVVLSPAMRAPEPPPLSAAAPEPEREPPPPEDGAAPAEDAGPIEWTDPVGSETFGEGPDVLDEEALRELVRDILRDELQGVLGERITRNVRKLVRAEIARALASRDL